MTETNETWPAGATWVFQGTVAEDATGGTHICSLTVTPGAGNEMTVEYGNITVGATATAQTPRVIIDDGTNLITDLTNAPGITTSGATLSFPSAIVMAANSTVLATHGGFIVSGNMRLILKVSTAAISVTQTFAVACRIKGAMPTAVLADSVGTPALTVNTNKVF